MSFLSSKLEMTRKLLAQRGRRETLRVIGSRMVGGTYGRVHSQPGYGGSFASGQYYDVHEKWLTHSLDIEASAKPARDLFQKPSIAIIADLNLPQCKKYRVMQKLEAFSKAEISCTYSHWQDQPRSTNIMQTATTVLLYRVPLNDLVEFYYREAHRLGLTIGYDIDDPIFDDGVYSINTNLSYVKPEEKRSLLSQCGAYAAALRRSDFVTVSTPGMAERASKIYSGPIEVWRNLIDVETFTTAQRAITKAKSDTDQVVIGYMSGSRAHEADFRTITNVLAKILMQNPHVTLYVLGHLEVPSELQEFSSRIETEAFTNYENYIEKLSQVDINIIPLKVDAFNECKSAIRYLEASIVNVPTISAEVGDFREVIANEGVGCLAATEQDWMLHLTKLVRSKNERTEMAARAREHVLGVYSLDTIDDRLIRNFV